MEAITNAEVELSNGHAVEVKIVSEVYFSSIDDDHFRGGIEISYMEMLKMEVCLYDENGDKIVNSKPIPEEEVPMAMAVIKAFARQEYLNMERIIDKKIIDEELEARTDYWR